MARLPPPLGEGGSPALGADEREGAQRNPFFLHKYNVRIIKRLTFNPA